MPRHQVQTEDIADGSISNVKRADMPDGTISGRALGAGAGVPTDLTPAQVSAMVNASGTFLSNPVNHIDFSFAPTGTIQAGRLRWNDEIGVLEFGAASGTVAIQIGTENVIRAVNKTGALLTDGTCVYISGAQGNRPTITKAVATSEPASYVVGVVTENIQNNEEGFVTTFGLVHGFDTSAFTDGAILYLSTTAGGLTMTRPAAPNHGVFVGIALNSTVNGVIFVNPDWGNEISELHDVLTSSVGNGNVLQYDSAASVWKNKQPYSVDQNAFGFVADYAGNQQTTISFNGTGTFTLAPTGTTWDYYRQGIEYTITGSKSVALAGSTPASEGLYYIYIDNTTGDLTSSLSSWTLEDTKVCVATVVWNYNLSPKYWLANERHTVSVTRRYHWEHHYAEGTEVLSPPILSGYTVTPSSPANSDNTFGISSSTIADEDLKHVIPAIVDPSGTMLPSYVVDVRVTGAWNWPISPMPYVYTSGSYINYDNAGVLTPVTATDFTNTYMLITNKEGTGGYAFLHSPAQFTTLALAQAEKFSSVYKSGVPISEYVAVYQLTWQTSPAYSTLGKCRLAAEPVAISVSASGNTAGGTVDHEQLTGLQGGAVGEHYHLTTADGLEAAAFFNGGSGTHSAIDTHLATTPLGITGTPPIYVTGTPTAPIVAIYPATTGTAGSMSANDFNRLNTCIDISPTTANVSASTNAKYFADISGLTANRNFILPAGAVGDEILLALRVGDATYSLIVIGDTGITINGGSAATEWSRLFISGEHIKLIATSTTNWQVVIDGRIPSMAKMYPGGAAQSIAKNTVVIRECNVSVYDNAQMVTTGTYRITCRRTGKYWVAAAGMMTTGQVCAYYEVGAYKNGTTGILSFIGSIYSTASYPYGVVTLVCPLTAADYVQLYLYHESAADRNSHGTLEGAASISILEILT
jgi:hypothetical protein